MNKLYIQVDNEKELKYLLNELLERNIKHENKNKIKNNLFVRLNKEGDKITFEVSKLNIDSNIEEINKFKELLNKYNKTYISFKEYEHNNFNNDFYIYTNEYKINKRREDIIDYIKWQLEANSFKIDEPLYYKGEEKIQFNGKNVNFLEFIEITDNEDLLKYALDNLSLLDKIDFNNLEFNSNSIKCNQILSEFKELNSKKYEFN